MAKTSISASITVKDNTDIAKVVLMPGDPLRAKHVADHYLENPVCFNTIRNMLGYTGTYRGKKISVMGSGMGIPSLGIYATELYNQFDVDAIIRIGSAGGLSDKVKVRDVVIAMAASTNSSYGDAYGIPGQLAAAADYGMLADSVAAAKELKVNAVVGNVYSSDFFYYPQSDLNQKLRDFGHLAVEMEAAGLYWTAAACHKKALSILTISDHIFTGEALSAEERQNSFHDMMKVALETAWHAIP
ncbi:MULTISPECIES: purine-nucleoside phosphorylase [Caproicibacterium]|jgi:purine-nucleoside phosphorylase|uniref:Purine nucleoside phosphorylase DeoD-type n=1 Tax=Caproicibacterium lactatifermentans TaxID=2666138 RepID=A0A859DPR9_9FIRM|nr:purine-nucleoside phosphorylase [Caproicibacterium lactatifermentans]ARP50450.1 purine-nucleoside phosphorylase [Ruminococcaceae bacterium CPB6]QKN23828.1 purine-nucleoside phosphorylase [Caproicibacterium lactatifermentans]QKO31100.1 purine-nucleoside phosphorylase [Caproicibacterium lactatifermentans]